MQPVAKLLVLSGLLATLLVFANAKRTGAPLSTCSTLTPVHALSSGDYIMAQRSSSPYSLQVIRTGDAFRVVILSETGDDFSGFVLQPRSYKDKSKIIEGRFIPRVDISKAIDCFGGRQNTLTHINPSPKREVVSEWMPTEDVNDEVFFRATVVKSYQTFWTEIDSPPFYVHNVGSSSKPENKKSEKSQESMYSDCLESRKGCFGIPSSCIDNRNCEVLLSFTYGDGINIFMSGKLDSNHYMAFGVSYDNRMGEDAVFECVRRDSDIIVSQSYNPEYRNYRVREFPRNRYKSDFSDGIATCSFNIDYLIETNGKRYDLGNRTYYALLAKGPVQGSELGFHSLKLASSRPVNFTAFEAIEGDSIHDAVKVHATFMVTGWVLLVSIGIVIARFFKNSFQNKKINGLKVWFVIHRGLMITALFFIVVAFIVIFVHKNGWNKATSNPHAILGCIATALGLFQPIMAAFRPEPDSPKRPIFNYMHWIVGNSAQIIAVITIFFSVTLPSAGLKDSFYYVISIFVIVHCIFLALFQLHIMTAGKKKKNEVKMLEMNSGRTGENSTPEKSLGDGVFRSLLLGVHVIFLVIIILALYALIGVA